MTSIRWKFEAFSRFMKGEKPMGEKRNNFQFLVMGGGREDDVDPT